MNTQKKRGSFLVVAFLLTAYGCGDSYSDSSGPPQGVQNAEDDSSTAPTEFVSEGERLNLDIRLAGMAFTGYVQIGTIAGDGTLTATVNISGMPGPVAVTGQVRGTTFEIDDFSIDHNLASGEIRNLRGSIVSTGQATGTFRFLLETSNYYTSFEGYEFDGSFTLTKEGIPATTPSSTPPTSSSLDEFVILNHTYDVAISIAGFGLSATAKVTAYNKTSGEFSARFMNEEYDVNTLVAGEVVGETLEFDSFRITSPFVTGTISNMQGEFDGLSGEVSGNFSFKLEASTLFEDFVGGTFGGNFTVK